MFAYEFKAKKKKYTIINFLVYTLNDTEIILYTSDTDSHWSHKKGFKKNLF